MKSKYISGIDPSSGGSLHVLQIYNKQGKLIITKVNPAIWINPDKVKEEVLNCSEIVERFKSILTEEDINKLKNEVKN